MSDGTATLQVYDYLRPGIPDGTYTISVEQDVDVAGAPAEPPSDSRKFTVQGPRFALSPTEVHAVFPPAHADGPFSHVLPHVMLTSRTLPWERTLEGRTENVPWLALLVLDAADLPQAAGPTGAVTMSVKEFLAGGKGVVAPAPHDAVSSAESGLSCQVLKIPLSTFAKVAPSTADLPLLAHVRQVDVSRKANVEPGDTGWYAAVVANRRPTAGATGIAHLVSLEGHQLLLDGKATGTEAWLVSLTSWSFSATDDTSPSFGSLAAGLAKPRPGERQDLALGLPYDGNDAASARLAAGYVPIAYHLPTGEDTFAWYRGPLAPRASAPLDKKARPFQSSSAALVYEPATGLFDVSLAAAWEIGRAVALADRKFATELVRFRRGVHRLVDLVVAALESQHIKASPANLKKIAKSGLIQDTFVQRLTSGLAKQVQTLSKDAPAPSAAAGQSDPQPQPDPVDAVKTLLAGSADLEALIAREVGDDLLPIAKWLASLTHLHSIPYAYLVPHPELLPDESIRFFVVDANWTGALFDGATSVGVASSRDAWFQGIARKIIVRAWRTAEHAPAAAGFLLRSALVSGWPGLDVAGTKGDASLELVRSELLAPNLMLCLFSGIPDQVQVRIPHQILHFGVKGKLRWRDEAAGVLDVAAAAKAAGAKRPAQFARAMLAAPEQFTFARGS